MKDGSLEAIMNEQMALLVYKIILVFEPLVLWCVIHTPRVAKTHQNMYVLVER